MTSRADIVAAARGWLGTRWQHQASLRGVGCDCIGLVAGVARECGIAQAAQFAADQSCMGYGRAPDPAMLAAAADRYLDRIELAQATTADVLVMRFGPQPQHFALITAPRRIIHAYAQARRVVEHALDAAWERRIVSAYAFRGVG